MRSPLLLYQGGWCWVLLTMGTRGWPGSHRKEGLSYLFPLVSLVSILPARDPSPERRRHFHYKLVECENTVRFTVSSLKSQCQKHRPRNSETQLPRVLRLGFSVLVILSTSLVPSTLRMPPASVQLPLSCFPEFPSHLFSHPINTFVLYGYWH